VEYGQKPCPQIRQKSFKLACLFIGRLCGRKSTFFSILKQWKFTYKIFAYFPYQKFVSQFLKNNIKSLPKIYLTGYSPPHGHAVCSQPVDNTACPNLTPVQGLRKKFPTGNFQDNTACPKSNRKPQVRGGGGVSCTFLTKKSMCEGGGHQIRAEFFLQILVYFAYQKNRNILYDVIWGK